MKITQNGDVWIAETPPKINLFFEVYRKRGDGFHEIKSVAVPLDAPLDTLTFKAIEQNTIRFQCLNGSEDIPKDGNNIVVKAVKKTRQHFNIRHGAEITLTKRIPSQAGLGGGSGNAAAAIRLAQKAWNIETSDAELIQLSGEIGSDCPIFFFNAPTQSSGRGDVIEPLPAIKPLWFVLWKPGEGLSTADVYRECMPLHKNDFRQPESLINALQDGDVETIAANFFNRLEVPARKLWRRFDTIKQTMLDAGCVNVQMSGSGTTFFGLCYNEGQAVDTVAKLPYNETVFIASTRQTTEAKGV